MANELHNVLPEVLVTKQNLIDQGFAIKKKFVMVDSRAYTQEAFEYVLKLADLAGSLVFVYDLKKIWANGRYFGGDVFQDDLNYWTNLYTIDNNGLLTGETKATGPQSSLVIQGKSHVKAKAIFDEGSLNKNILEINYDLNEAVNTQYVQIGGNRYNIVVENDQIKFNEYIPIKVTCSGLTPLEYDSVEESAPVSFKISVTGSLPPTILDVTNNLDLPIEYDAEQKTISCNIPRNTDVTFVIAYSDGVTGGTTSITQHWGYGVYVGIFDTNIYSWDYVSSLVDLTTMDTVKKLIWVPGTTINYTENINQNETQYGFFMCPESIDIEFIDVSTNLTGGWTPLFNMIEELYENKIKYLPYRTDHLGLGLVTWKIKGTN